MDNRWDRTRLILNRSAVADYQAKQAALKQKIQALEEADDSEDETTRSNAVQDLSTFMEQNQKSKTHTPTDPNKLPFGTPDGKVRGSKGGSKGTLPFKGDILHPCQDYPEQYFPAFHIT